jgi:hypothetical protein
MRASRIRTTSLTEMISVVCINLEFIKGHVLTWIDERYVYVGVYVFEVNVHNAKKQCQDGLRANEMTRHMKIGVGAPQVPRKNTTTSHHYTWP